MAVGDAMYGDISHSRVRAVITGTGQGAPIRRERHRIDPIRMAFEGVNELAAAHLPQPHRAVITVTGQGGPVR